MNAFDQQAIADQDRQDAVRRAQRLNAAGILMDVLGYSVRQALLVRDQFSDAQLARLDRAFHTPEPQRRSTILRILREAGRPQKPRRSRRRNCKSAPPTKANPG